MKVLEKLKSDVILYPEQAKGMTVTDTLSLGKANTFLVAVKSMRKEVGKTFDPIIKKAHESHREALEAKKKFEKPLIAAELIIKPQIASYFGKIERERRAAEEVARKAEEERTRKEEELLEEAIQAEESGDAEKADEILAEEVPEVAAVEYPAAPKLEGTHIRKIWKWQVSDINLIPRKFLIVNPNMLTFEVRQNKGDTKIPGVNVYAVDVVSTRG